MMLANCFGIGSKLNGLNIHKLGAPCSMLVVKNILPVYRLRHDIYIVSVIVDNISKRYVC